MPTLAQVQSEYTTAATKAQAAVDKLQDEIDYLQEQIDAANLQKVDAQKKADAATISAVKSALQSVADNIDSSIEEKEMLKLVRTAQQDAWKEANTLFTLLSTYNPAGSQGVQGV